MKKIVTFLIIIYSISVQAQENSLLWRVSGNGLTQDSYLYGTFHSKDSRAHQFGDSVLIKLAQSDMIIVESIVEENLDKEELMKIVLMKDITLEDLLDKNDYEFVKKEVIKKLGIVGMLFNNMKPFFTSEMIAETSRRNEMPFTVDNFLRKEGEKQGKKIVTLETIDAAMIEIDKISLKEQAKMLIDFLRDYENQLSIEEQFSEMYYQQNIKEMYDYYENLDDIPLSFQQGIVDNRNKKFVKGLIPHLQDNSVFCAVGTLHLLGETGLINSLRKKGYTVEPIFSEYHFKPLTIGRRKWQYISDDTLNMVMGFPELPYYENVNLSNTDNSKTINLLEYFFTDTLNNIKYSIRAARLNNVWTEKEVLATLIKKESYKIIKEEVKPYYNDEAGQYEFYISKGINKRTIILIQNSILYIIEVEGSKQKIYSDLAEYFLLGVHLGDVQSFQEILNNTDNFTIDMVGALSLENKDTVLNYQIFVVEGTDTTIFKIEDGNKFEISLELGHKYIFGFKKEGYQQKHLVVDVVESGTPFDSKYGFDFPMNITLLKGNENAHSIKVATIKYNPFTGYMDFTR